MSIQNKLLSNKRLWVRLISLAIIIGIALLKPKFDEWMAKGKSSDAAVAQSNIESGKAKATRTSTAGTSDSGSSPSLDDLLASVRDDSETEDRTPSTDFQSTKTTASKSNGKTASQQQTQSKPQTKSAGSSKSNPKSTSSGSSKKDGGGSQSDTSKTNPGGANSSTAKTGSSSKSESREKPLGDLVLIKGTRDEFRSTAGLMYVPGSADGHRLKHVLKHASDNPSKPVHGVFDGDRPTILAWIDRTYLMGKKGGKGVRVEEQRGRTVYTANLNERIGYVGGQKGKRNGNKECRYLRLVVQNGNEVVTAYPADRM